MNIRDVLTQLGVRFWEHGQSPLVTSGWLGLVCPKCDGGKGKPGLGIHVRSLKASCWRCGGANLVAALADISEKPYGAVKALLGDMAPAPGPEARAPGKLELPPGIGPLLPAHRKYLSGRGFDPDELVERWGIGGIGPHHGVYSWRVFVPVHGPRGEVVSWTTRAIGDVPHGMRYRGASDKQSKIPRGEVLYGEHHARHAVVCCEGPFDALAIGPGAVATAGVGFSRTQVLRLSRFPVRAICFDSDWRAQRRARQLADQLAVFEGETHILQVSGRDPAEAPKDEIQEIRERFLT